MAPQTIDGPKSVGPKQLQYFWVMARYPDCEFLWFFCSVQISQVLWTCQWGAYSLEYLLVESCWGFVGPGRKISTKNIKPQKLLQWGLQKLDRLICRKQDQRNGDTEISRPISRPNMEQNASTWSLKNMVTRQENLSLREQIVNLREQAIEAKVGQERYTCRRICKMKGHKIIYNPQDPLVFPVKLKNFRGIQGATISPC